MVLVASEPIDAGGEIRIDYEDGNTGSALYWGAPNIPGQPHENSAWRWARRNPPPPAANAERLVDGLAQLQRAAATGGSGGDAAAMSRASAAAAVGRSLLLELCEENQAEPPLPWDGEQGGDARLRLLVPLLARELPAGTFSDSRPSSNWGLVATHMPGRSGRECFERWQALAADGEVTSTDTGTAAEPVKSRRQRCGPWTEEELTALAEGVRAFGDGKWREILIEYGAHFNPSRTCDDLCGKWRYLQRRGTAEFQSVAAPQRPTTKEAFGKATGSPGTDGEADSEDEESDEEAADGRKRKRQKRFIPRPRGRGPVGKEWDTSIGGWVPMGMSNGEAWVSTRLPDGKRYRPDRRRELGKDKRERTAARQEGGGKRGNTSQPMGGLCGGGSRGYSSNSDGDGIGQRRMLSLQPVRAKATVLPSGRVELRLERHKDHPASAAVESGEPMEEEEDGAQTPPLHLRPRSMQIDADGGPAVKDEEADAQEADSSDDDCDAEAAHERHVANWQRLAAARAAARAATNASGASSAKRGPEAPLVSSRPASKEAMCGTFGCILLNNHRGLHQLPPDAADRPRGVRSKRMEPLPGETEAELLPGGLFARGRRKEVAEPFELCQPAAPTSPAESSGGVVKADKNDGEPKAEADGEDIVTEAEGYQLHLSVGSSTGYAGVYRKGGAGAGAVEVRFQGHYLGRFETPLQGAIAYAKYHLTEGQGKGETQVEKKPGKKAPGKKAEAASKGPETLPLVEKVKLIQRELGIAESTLIKQTLDDANETLGIAPPAGQSIKEQVEVVLQQIAY